MNKRFFFIVFLVISSFFSVLVLSQDNNLTNSAPTVRSSDYLVNIPQSFEKFVKVFLGLNNPTPLNMLLIHSLVFVLFFVVIYWMVDLVPMIKGVLIKAVSSLFVLLLVVISGGAVLAYDMLDSLNAKFSSILSIENYTLNAAIICVVAIVLVYLLRIALKDLVRDRTDEEKAERDAIKAGVEIGLLKKKFDSENLRK